MKDHGPGHGGYVRQVQEGTRGYAHDLLAENERLRQDIAQLEADRGRLAAAARQLDGALGDNAALHAENGALRAQRDVLTEQLARVREQAESQTHRQIELELRLQDIEEANRRFSDDYLRIQHQNANLANLYVASYRLHGTAERGEVVLAIQEIIANLIGSEELAIFEREPDGAPSSRWSRLRRGRGSAAAHRGGRRAHRAGGGPGEIYVRGEGDGAASPPPRGRR